MPQKKKRRRREKVYNEVPPTCPQLREPFAKCAQVGKESEGRLRGGGPNHAKVPTSTYTGKRPPIQCKPVKGTKKRERCNDPV